MATSDTAKHTAIHSANERASDTVKHAVIGSSPSSTPPTTAVMNLASPARASFQKAIFAYHRGDYSIALNEFEAAAALAEKAGDEALCLQSFTYLLRILAEREDFARIDSIEKGVFAILASKKEPALTPALRAQALHVLGICNCYRGQYHEARHDLAMTRFREAIDFAMLSGDKSALAPPLYGAATVLYAQNRYAEALHELDRLGILMSCLDLPDLRTAVFLLRSMIRRNQNELNDALEWAWKAFESLKHHPQLVLYLHTLCVLGEIFTAKGDAHSARLYLDLASRSLKRDDLKRVARLVDEAIEKLGSSQEPEAELIFDSRTGLLWEKNKGEIRFERQFILRDLLLIFLENPGRVFTKSELAEKVWRGSYNPNVHDNKIYVTIKRLRQLLELDDSKANYILRAKTGYFLNPKVRVQINDQSIFPAVDTAGAPMSDTERTK